MVQNKSIDNLIQKFNLKKESKTIITQSFYHSSYSNEQRKHLESNERLEFLGDNVLNLIVTSYLYKKYPNISEGVLSKKRAQLICEEALVVYAEEIALSKCLFLGKGEEKNGGRKRNLIIADSFEAFIGAIFLSHNFQKAQEVLLKIILPVYKKKKINMNIVTDYKTNLQEIVNTNLKKRILYKVIKEEGLPHEKKFTVIVLIDDCVYGKGTGSSKKNAEQRAAYDAISKIALKK